jgi:hypothetical protein
MVHRFIAQLLQRSSQIHTVLHADVHRTELLMNDFQYLRTTNGLHLCIELVIVYLASVVDILPLWYLQTDIATTSSL